MVAPRPILILTASAGAGHGVAATAIAEALRARCPHLPVMVHDVLDSASAIFRVLYGGGYLGLVRHVPVAMGWLYDAMDRPGSGVRQGLRSMFQNVNVYRTMRLLITLRPRLIVNTHFLPAEIVAQMRRTRRLKCPQATVTTDFETHRIWVQPPTERYFTATEEGREYLRRWDVPAESVIVSGIPVRAAFEQTLDRAAVRAGLGLAADRPVVLVLCGGFGVGPTADLLDGLLETREEAQIVVVTGRNDGLRRRIEARAAGRPAGRVRVVGFTRRMHEWMRAADLVVTKPGGLTAAEALVCGLPMVIVNPIPGQETRNSDYLLERGAAIKVNNLRMLGYRVQRLLDEPRRLALLRQCALRLAQPGAAQRIAEEVQRML